MRWVLIKHASISCSFTLILALILAFALGTPEDALATAVGALVASLDFLAIVWIVTGLFDEAASTPSKAALGVLLVGKLLFVGALLYAAVVRFGMGGIGVPLGIGAAIMGFTWGMVRGTGSREGLAAIAAEERRLGAEEKQDA